MHQCRLVQATRVRSRQAIFLDKQSYKIDISLGYDHAFILSLAIIMNHYLHQDHGQAVVWLLIGYLFSALSRVT